MTEPKPSWIKIRFIDNSASRMVESISKTQNLFSVCQSAHCPNRSECWAKGTATFMIMGEYCTRACRFCAVKTSPKPLPLDPNEPEKLADAISKLELTYVVVTSVTRDDLTDSGSDHFADCIRTIRNKTPKTIIEVLVPDFRADKDAIQTIIDAKPDVVSHNVETIERLTPGVRDIRATYSQSLETLRLYKELSGKKIITKSGIMLGFGENEKEVGQTMKELREVGVEILTIGQYLQPTLTPRHLAVKEYVHPNQFKKYEQIGYKLGFKFVASGPLVRSSYKAAEPFIKGILKRVMVSK